MPIIKTKFSGNDSADIIAASAICELDVEAFIRVAVHNAIREARESRSLTVYAHDRSTGLQHRGRGCQPGATAGFVRHFLALDAVTKRAVASYLDKNRTKAARDAGRVWSEFRDLASLCVAEKSSGRNVEVFTLKAAPKRASK